MNAQPHLTVAQFRMAGRARAGERLPVSRYLATHPTIASLVRKDLFVSVDQHWQLTPRGRDVYANHGKVPATAQG